MTRTNSLKELSNALAALSEGARGFTTAIRWGSSRWRSGIAWRSDVVVASEQALGKVESYEIVLAGGASARAALAGRDAGTNVAVLKLESTFAEALPEPADPLAGSLALACAADGYGGIAAHLGIISSAAPEWRSRAGGKIDRRITLDVALSECEEGGPVLDASGALLGMSTLGHRGNVLVIPPSTIARSVEALLAHGRIERGWLGVALQPVAIPDGWREAAASDSGLMVMSMVADGPAARAGLVAGDILIGLDGARAGHARNLAERLGPDSIGREMELTVLRGGAAVPLRTTVASWPADG
ncbi:MAG TPA: S1C family serine protease [Rhizomicrobium sp.]|jgi:S1-C subfamily serine protease